MADAWLGISSSELDSDCGSTSGYTVGGALDGTSFWYHSGSLPHWFIIDLGATYLIKKMQGRSITTGDPYRVDVYVSDDKESWGDAVATDISTWQDTSTFVEIDTVDKEGRYIYVAVTDTEAVANWIQWGNISSPFTIFDAYGDVVAAPAVRRVFITQ